jgi:hypothetical protein
MEDEMSGRIPARPAKLCAALLASTAVMATAAATAGAIPTGGAGPSLRAAALSSSARAGAGRVPGIPFTAEYDAESYYGPVACKGKHETSASKGYPGTATEGGRDVERCKSTTGLPLVGLTPGETVTLGEGWFPGSSGWNSDYDGQGATEIAYTVSANGKSFKLVAYYPFAG